MIALDTSDKKSFIVVENKGEKFFAELESDCRCSENVMCRLDQLLNEASLDINDENDFAVVVGPGSFTGIRIAVSLIKGILSNRSSYNLIPLSKLEFIAYVYSKNEPLGDFLCVMDALSDKVFVQRFNSSGKSLSEPAVVQKHTLAYSDCPVVCKEDEDFSNVKIKLTCEELLNFAKFKLGEGEKVLQENLVPLYLRKPQAEENLENC